MEQNRKDYIVIRRPANNLGKPICPIYFVISREHLSKYVDKYLDGKIKRNPILIVKGGELWIVLLVICVILLKINLILN